MTARESIEARYTHIAHDYAVTVGYQAAADLEAKGCPVTVRSHNVGLDLVVSKLPGDEFGLTVSVYADVNDAGGVVVALVTEAGETLQTIKLRTVAHVVAVQTIVSLATFAHGLVTA